MRDGRMTEAALRLCLLSLFFPFQAFADGPASGAALKLQRTAVNSGGNSSSGASYVLHASLGEAASSFAGASKKLLSGHQPLVPQPGTVTSIVAVAKTTGTIELAWTAPGRDGFQGSVSGGYYRIDYSSDAAHVFAPTTWAVEFATSVQPGAAQSYTLTGLKPNTTYYARVYLADAAKTVAETSAASEESSLAEQAVFPSVGGVFSSSVVLTWSLPPTAVSGFRLDASSGVFDALFPGGVVVSSLSRSGLTVSMTVSGLEPDTTYYLRVGSLNWQDAPNFTSVITVRTGLGGPKPIENLASTLNGAARTILFSWTNPQYLDPAGVLVQISTSPISAGTSNGTAYLKGDAFGDGSSVEAAAAAADHLSASLSLSTTYYYRFYSKDAGNNYSVFVSTVLLLDLPPMAPGALSAALSLDRSSITLSWAGVTSSSDGTPFFSTAAPKAVELTGYGVYRATSIVRPGWVFVDSASADALSWTVAVPDPAQRYYYRVDAEDAVGPKDKAMIIDTDLNVYAAGPDHATRLKIPAGMAGELRAGGNAYGVPLLVRTAEAAAGGEVLKAVSFDALRVPEGTAVRDFKFSTPELDIFLKYEVVNGEIVPAQTGLLSAAGAGEPRIAAAEASNWLAPYWFNGKEYVKMFGDVDEAEQTVRVRTALPGSYQLRRVFTPSQFSFDLRQVSNKAITPNGDGLNDFVLFRLNNPQDSAVTGEIFDVRGVKIADMKPGAQVAQSLMWDGKADGRAVGRGVYIYQIKAEGKTFNGTVVVIR